MKFEKQVLEGMHVRLEPLAVHHKKELCRVIDESALWKIFVTSIPHPDDIDDFYAEADLLFEQNEGLVFAILDKKTNTLAGSTRFTHAAPEHKRLEVGFSFLGKPFQKTRINTEAKFLLLRHAFEVFQVNRVEFIADYLNNISRHALLRLGAKQEGIIRNHVVMRDGRVRDTVLFSIIANEWAGVKQNLLYRLEQ